MSRTALCSINSQTWNSIQPSEAAIIEFSTINNFDTSVHSMMRSGCFSNLEKLHYVYGWWWKAAVVADTNSMTTLSVSLRSMGFQVYFQHTGDFEKNHTKFSPLLEELYYSSKPASKQFRFQNSTATYIRLSW